MNTPRKPLSINPKVRSDATDWLLRFSEGDTDTRTRADFLQWLRASPEHVHAYLRICALWQEADQIDGKPVQRDIDHLVQLAASEANVELISHIRAYRQNTPEEANRPWKWIAAASVMFGLLGAIGGAWYFQVHALGTYSTELGEQRTVNLPDGSTVLVNARSKIKVKFTDLERDVELLEGQALFRVAQNASRPFVVHSDGVSVRALGTQFDVARTTTGTVVSVVEGKVAVDGGQSATAVAAGEQAVVTRRVVVKPPAANVLAATAWTRGLLMFDDTSLAEVIREFNQQNPKAIVLTDPRLARLTLSGSFPATGTRRLIRFLEERFHVTVVETDQEIRISIPQ